MEFSRCYSCMQTLNTPGAVCPHCGYDNTAGPAAQPDYILPCGTVLDGRYVIGKKLGQGGFGISYIAYNLALDTTVCIKEYFPAGAAMFDLDDRRVGPGQTIIYDLRLDGPETFNALAICPADKGMDFVVRLSPIFIVPERNLGEYSSGLIEPSYTPVDPSTMRPQTTHQETSEYKTPTGPGSGSGYDGGGNDYKDPAPGTKTGADDWYSSYGKY